jgi:acylphosphatase
MKEIVFETGLVTYSLNGKCEVTFNPTDSNFVKRLYEAFEHLDKRQEAYQKEIDGIKDQKKIFDIAESRDREMREIVDSVFGADVCDKLVGDTNIYALANGLPIWCNLMLSIMDEIDTSFAREQKVTNTRIAKYTSKYHKK